MLRKFTDKITLALVAALVAIAPNAQADEGCGCGTATQSYASGSYVTDSGCGGCGSGGGNFISKMRAQVNCDPAMRTNLWDGYCQERTACDSTGDCGNGGLLGGGLHARHGGCGGGCGLKLFSGSRLAGCGLSGGCGQAGGCGGSCFAPAAASCGCGHIFGASSCFRNDGHFFGNFRRHHCSHQAAAEPIYADSACGCEAPSQSCSGCGLFQHHRNRGGFLSRFKGLFQRGGSCGCGHFGGGCDSNVDYDFGGGCGCSQATAAPTCGCDG